MTLNKIYTDEEYMAQGFEAWEVPLIRRHDELFNKYQQEDAWDTLTDEQIAEFSLLVKTLGI